MPRQLTDQERDAFLAERRTAVLSVASGDGRPPLTVPVWYAYQPDIGFTFFTGTQGRKARKSRLIEQAGRLSLCVQHGEAPYKYVTAEGTVVRTDRPPSAEQLLTVLRRYLPEEMAQGFVAAELSHPASELVLYTVRPDRWSSLDFGAEG